MKLKLHKTFLKNESEIRERVIEIPQEWQRMGIGMAFIDATKREGTLAAFENEALLSICATYKAAVTCFCDPLAQMNTAHPTTLTYHFRVSCHANPLA